MIVPPLAGLHESSAAGDDCSVDGAMIRHIPIEKKRKFFVDMIN
jgi:hypothetical protein